MVTGKHKHTVTKDFILLQMIIISDENIVLYYQLLLSNAHFYPITGQLYFTAFSSIFVYSYCL